MPQMRESEGSALPADESVVLEDADVTQRQQIAEAACRVIARGGVGDATFRRIATELGATTGLISHYFASKADLLNYTINYAQERLLQQGTSMVWPAKENFVDDLCQAIQASQDGTAGPFWRVWVAYLGVAIVDEDVRAEYLEWDDISRLQIVSLIRTELGEGASTADVELLSDSLNALATGLGVHAMLAPERLTAERIRIILSLFFQSIAAAREPEHRKNKTTTSNRVKK